jgi:hypothetical protein
MSEASALAKRRLKCPVNGCWRQRKSSIHVMCPYHWFKVPPELRDKIWRLYRTEPGSDSHRMAIQAAIEDVDGQESLNQEQQ